VYDEAKRFAEALIMAYRRAHGVDTATVRILTTFGPRMRPDDGRAIPTFVGQALRGEPLTVAGDGSQSRSICYVDDLVEGIVRPLRSHQPGPVNIGNPHEPSVLALAETVRDLIGTSSPITFIDRPVDDPTVRQPDITLARTALGPWGSAHEGPSATQDAPNASAERRMASVRPPMPPRGAPQLPTCPSPASPIE